ncbi:MAG: hypothetical protein PWR24_780 [Desulfonauticus sp.]|nr:hypothetical protein [Desulfonauticus sp.]
MKTIFAKYNRERLPEYQIVTKIVEDNQGKRYALKEPLCPEAWQHLNNIFKNYKLLQTTYKLNLAKPKKIKQGLIFEFIDGNPLDLLMLKAIKNNDRELFQEYLERFLGFVDSMVSKRKVIFKPSLEFEKIFGKWEIETPQDIMELANVDISFENIFLDKDGKFFVIDYEWVFNFEIPKDYIIWRSLFVFSLHHSVDMLGFANIYGLDDEKLSEINNNFMKYIYGNYKYIVSSKSNNPSYKVDLDEIVEVLSTN